MSMAAKETVKVDLKVDNFHMQEMLLK